MTFHEHLELCAQCRDHPFALCPAGMDLLEREALPLEVIALRLVEDSCCDLCNPIHLADFDRQCVRIRINGGDRFICLECLMALARAAQGSNEQIVLHAEVVKIIASQLRRQKPTPTPDGTVH